MQTEGIIFDLDGTLIHTIEDIAGAANRMFHRHGLPTHDIAYYLKWIGSGAVKFIELALGEEVDHEQLMAYVADFKDIYSKNLHDKSRVYDGIPELLDELTARGVKLSILSNKPHIFTEKVAHFYLSQWAFRPVFGQREGVHRKPDPSGALEIAQLMKVEPGKILFVGDSDNDILTAQAAGMIPLGVTWGYGRLATQPVDGMGDLIDQPSDLLSKLSITNT
jgi:phosphoglycolate phosphatase